MKWLFLSLVYAVLLASLANVDLENDSGQYYKYGKNLVQTGVYGVEPGVSDMGREPGYGFFLSLLFRLGFSGLRGIVFAQALLFFWIFWAVSFKTFLRGRESSIYFFLCIFSPTLAGSATVIYSETLAISLVGLFFLTLYKSSDLRWNRVLRGGCLFLAAASFAALILTKSYFQFFPYFFFIFSIIFLAKKEKSKALSLGFCAVLGLLGSFLWNHRNHEVMGTRYFQYRLDNALAGKILRLESMHFPQDLSKAFSAAVGTNFCRRLYSTESCVPFEILGADVEGSRSYEEYNEKYPDSHEKAEIEMKKNLIAHFWSHPFLQIFGSFLETLRMSFFEASQRSSRLQWVNYIASAWHFIGSILFFVLAFLGVNIKYREIKNGLGPNQIFFLLAFSFIFYHWLFMSQITNLVRYVFPIIPCIYLFVALGIKKGYYGLQDP